jgi:quinol-cytochrome oxidoreductase complex cytochrome b subunit
LGHSDNYIPGNPMVTPPHIVPEWYFLPFYAILRSVPDKLGGVILMFAAILTLLLLPFSVGGEIRSSAFRPLYRLCFWFFLVDVLLLGWVGANPVKFPYLELGQVCTFFYFFYLILLLPAIPYIESFFWGKQFDKK